MSFCIFIEVWYNMALCYYELKQYAQAVQHLGAIVEKGIKEYPGIIK
jgi:tetratricopeptide (TPR) repeat protein